LGWSKAIMLTYMWLVKPPHFVGVSWKEAAKELYSASVSGLVVSVQCMRAAQCGIYMYTDWGRIVCIVCGSFVRVLVHCFWKSCSCTCHAIFGVSVRTICIFVQMWCFYYCSMKYTYHYTWDKEIIVNSQKLVNRRWKTFRKEFLHAVGIEREEGLIYRRFYK